MVKIKQRKTLVAFRPSIDDWKLLDGLIAKLKLADSTILRLAIRALAEKEGVGA